MFCCSRLIFFARVLLNCFAHINYFDRNLFNFIVCDLLNCFALIWFNCFACSYTIICLIFLERDHTIFLARSFVERDHTIFLTIFLYPIVYLLWGYTITIDVNVFNVIVICSILFRICCTNYLLFMTTVNMLLHVSVYGMYLSYLIVVHIHNIFHLTDGSFVCWTHAFKGWSAE